MMRICQNSLIYMGLLLVCGGAIPMVLTAQDNVQDDPSQQLRYVQYADESTPKNNLVMDFNGATAYDDNVLGDNADRQGAMVFQTGAHFGWEEERARFSISLDYQPEFVMYSNVSGYNQIDQTLRFSGKYHVSRHFELRFQNSGFYFTGIASPTLNENATFTSGPQPTLNNTVLIPLAHEITDEARMDGVYQISRRSALDVFSTVGIRNFSGVKNSQETLLNTQTLTGGLAYTYRVNASSTLGVSAQHQNLRYGSSLDRIESAFLTFTWQGKSGLSASLYGGPQYVRLKDSFLLPTSSAPTTTYFLARESGTKLNAGGGASLGWRSNRTVVQASVQQIASDGGGVFTSVTDISESFDVRRELRKHWDLLMTVTTGQSRALSGLFGGAVLSGQAGSLSVERDIGSKLVAQVGYQAGRQRVSGTYPFQVDMNRNYISLGFIFRFNRIPLGR
jgi:hypothetical protein